METQKGSASTAKRTVFVVDDHPVFREGLIRVINQEASLTVCGEAADAVDAFKQIETLKPDLAIVDISLDGANGIDLVKSVRARFPKMRLLVLSMHPEALHAGHALRAGANGYIMKKEPRKVLLFAARQVLDGKTYVSEEFNERILQGLSNPEEKAAASIAELLSNRELEVFRLDRKRLAHGKSPRISS